MDLEQRRRPRPDRRVLPDELAERLQVKILDGTFKPGDRLPAERELAQQLGVNRSSVREALKQLEQLRLVKIQQGSGVRVRPPEQASLELVTRMLTENGRPNRPLIRDLLELRECLFVAIMPVALERASAEELRGCIQLIGRATRPELSDTEFLSLMIALQDTIARMTHNRVLSLLCATIGHFQRKLPVGVPRLALQERTAHVRALKLLAHAMEARDNATVMRALRELLERSQEAILQDLGSYDPAALRARRTG